MTDGAAASRELLRERLDAVPGALARAPHLDEMTCLFDVEASTSTIATGAGGSEGPARLFTYLMQQRGKPTRFEPLSAYLHTPPTAERCVLFSHSLSPNARLPLKHHRHTLVIGAKEPTDSQWLAHGPKEESGLLVRVIAPNVASLMAMRLAKANHEPSSERLAEAVQRCIEISPPLFEPYLTALAAKSTPLALVTMGVDPVAYTHGMRWLCVEGALMADPPAWDILQLAHGPYQQFFAKEMLLVVLKGQGQSHRWIEQLAKLMDPKRHRLVVLEANLPYPYCWFEHEAMVGELVYGLHTKSHIDLIDWPGKGRDMALYGIEHSDER